jgi:tetratricopeptide (TPR) repeat protein
MIETPVKRVGTLILDREDNVIADCNYNGTTSVCKARANAIMEAINALPETKQVLSRSATYYQDREQLIKAANDALKAIHNYIHPELGFDSEYRSDYVEAISNLEKTVKLIQDEGIS